MTTEPGNEPGIFPDLSPGASGAPGAPGASIDATIEPAYAAEIMAARMRLLAFADTHSLEELLRATLDELETLTNSQIGFYHFVEADQVTLSLQTWSSRTQDGVCQAEGEGRHYDVAEAGVWVDCVRQRRPVIHNDYAALPHGQGLPEGHVMIQRELVVPIFRDGAIVAILGVGNKPTDYTQVDVSVVSNLADLTYDLAGRKRMMDQLHQVEENYRTLVENAPDLIARFNTDLRHTYVNPAAAQTGTLEPEAYVGKSIAETGVPPDVAKVWEDRLRQVLNTGKMMDVVDTFPAPNGTAYFHTRFVPEYNMEGRLTSILSIARDITARKKTEEALRSSEARFRSWLENTSDLVTVVGLDGLVQYASPSYESILGYSPRELFGTAVFSFVHPDDVDQVMQIFAKAIQQPDSRASAEFRFRHKDGSWRTFEAIGRTYLDSKGDVVGLINSRDITERVQARQILHQRMTELEALYSVSKALRSTLSVEEALPIVLNATLAALHTDSGTVRMYNPDTNMLDSGTKKGWFKDISTAPMKPTIGIAGKVFTTGRTHISEDFAHDPHVVIRGADKIPSGWAGACVPIHVGQAVIGVMFVAVPHPRHISPEQIRLLESMAELTGTAVQRMSLYAQTQAQARRTQQILDSSPEGMLVLDADHCLVQVNPAALAYLPDLAELALGDVVTLLGGQPVTEFLHAIDPQQPWHELTGGEPPRVYEVAAQPLGSTQQPGGWVLLLRDVTADRERQRYQQAQDNLAIVGQMAAGIAHDFNNILGAITLYATLLDNSTGLSKKQHRYVDTIQDQSRHAAELVRQILDFGRRSIMTQTAVDMLSLVRESIKLMGRTLPENIRLNLSFERSEYMVFGDPTRLQQMLINLAFNARDAMPAGGDLTLQLSTITVVSGKQAPLPDMEPGVWIRLDVMDTGSGVAPKHLPHLFQPFFTTKGVGQGTGLGLAQVYGIVKQHEGVIEVESQVGQGTTFSIYLPLHQSAVEDDLPVTPLENAVGGGETILLVEDNDAIRQAVGDTLETLGYRVISTHSGQQALDILAEGADTISLLISDMVMPQVGGLEMAEIVATRHPDLGILIMSGHPLNMGNDVMQQANILGWIQKPFDIDLLAKQIRAILDAPSTM